MFILDVCFDPWGTKVEMIKTVKLFLLMRDDSLGVLSSFSFSLLVELLVSSEWKSTVASRHAHASDPSTGR